MKLSDAGEITKLEPTRLGRPYHRLPEIFNSKFDIIELRLTTWLLKKHRANLTLKKMTFEVDVNHKSAEIMSTPQGVIGFDLDRHLLLVLLDNFYGLESANPSTDSPLTKTELRLRSRLAAEMCGLLTQPELLDIPQPVKPSPTAICNQWAYRVSFCFGDEGQYRMHLLLDAAHTDPFLNQLRQRDSAPGPDNAPTRQAQAMLVNQLIPALPLRLNTRVAELSLDVATLAALQPGDILPLALPGEFPVHIGRHALFQALIVEDNDKLFLTRIQDMTTEKNYG